MKTTLILRTIPVLAALAGAADTEWKEFTSNEDRFQTQFPGTPTQGERTLSGLLTRRYSWSDPRGGIYGVTCYVLPESARSESAEQHEKRIKQAQDNFTKKGARKVLSDKKFTLDKKHTGRDIVVDVPERKALMRIRALVVEDRLYLLMSVGRKEWVESNDTRKFLESFKLAR